ncbi:DUF4365 domain-containing protein [Rhizohabitans arisaemae]|uniref:DUF4365 domain-containing protein n=1 Tax=Rhizohabitans arisaemae TaxID=2720610 RepID=UPI0024B1F539|nr:DUF4365 domain-containing protein [Rhizohabitans arisaemae]
MTSITMLGRTRVAVGMWRLVLNCEWCLDRNNHQGWYGECFIQVLAAAAGLQATPLTPDCTGVDFYLCLPREIDGDFPRMEVQVKTWSTPKSRNGRWHYRGLTEKRFNALAGKRRLPRYLFLVVVPPNAQDFVRADSHALQLSHAAYWISLEAEQRIDAPDCKRTVEVTIPESNLLTVASLLNLFDPLRAVEAP